MMLAPACLALGIGTVVAQNIPEIRDTIRSGERHAYGGTALYISTASISLAVAFVSTYMSGVQIAGPNPVSVAARST